MAMAFLSPVIGSFSVKLLDYLIKNAGKRTNLIDNRKKNLKRFYGINTWKKIVVDGKKYEFPYYEIARFTPEQPFTTLISQINFNDKYFSPSSDLNEIGQVFQALKQDQLIKLRKAFIRTYAANIDALGRVGRLKYDSRILRMSSCEQTEDGLKIQLQPARYIDQAGTNLCLDRHSNYLSSVKKQWTNLRSLEDDIQKEDCNLRSFSKSFLVNSIGLSTIVVDIQNEKFLLVKRKKDLAIFQNQIGPSASGALQYNGKIDNVLDFKNYLISEMNREIREELCITPDKIETRPIAFSREYSRGGKPQFFFISALKNMTIFDLLKDDIFTVHDDGEMKEWSKCKALNFTKAHLKRIRFNLVRASWEFLTNYSYAIEMNMGGLWHSLSQI